MNTMHSIGIVLVTAAVTVMLRFLPFLVFRGKRNMPELLNDLSRMLPYAIMGMLVVYCLRNVDLMSGSHGIPELIGCLCVVILYVWKRNTLLSIAAGTVLYMFLVQRIF